MNRKQVIIITVSIIIGVIIIVVTAVLIAAAVYGKALKVKTSIDLDGVDEDVRNILYYSSISANSHNTQLWVLKIYPNESSGTIEIRYDNERILNVVDKDKREAFLSIGHYIETMNMVFDSYGYDSSVTYFNVNKNKISSPVAMIQYSKNPSKDKSIDATISIVHKRHTNKKSFKKDKLKQEHIESLKSMFGDSIHVFSRGDSSFEYIKSNTISSVESQSFDQDYRDELANWLRFSNKESLDKLDGIDGDMMGFSCLKKGFYYMTTSRKSAKENRFAKQGISTTKSQVKNCGSFILITGDTQSIPKKIMDIGRLSQKMWFECTKMKISLQPISSILEIEPYKSKIQQDLGLREPVQMIFRAGYVKKYGANIKLRHNLRDYIEVVKK